MNQTHKAFDKSALFKKSQLYISRGYRAFKADDLDEYQLWASMALELLAKSALSHFSPTLVADPDHFRSLFSACGAKQYSDVKTIQASTLFKRIGVLDKTFDKRIEQFCTDISKRRNAELHSGEAPFVGMDLKRWENNFWHAIDVLLKLQEQDLEDWLDPQDAKEKSEFLAEAESARGKAISARIQNCKEEFNEKWKDDQEGKSERLTASASISPTSYCKKFPSDMDAFDLQDCPSCTGKGIVAGTECNEEVIDSDWEEDWDGPPIEVVQISYVTEEFWCPVCGLRLAGVQEVGASDIPKEFEQEMEREREFEPDYGND
ncbi:MAG: hypothetical protein ACE361_12120 [Aureliella sp.]